MKLEIETTDDDAFTAIIIILILSIVVLMYPWASGAAHVCEPPPIEQTDELGK